MHTDIGGLDSEALSLSDNGKRNAFPQPLPCSGGACGLAKYVGCDVPLIMADSMVSLISLSSILSFFSFSTIKF